MIYKRVGKPATCFDLFRASSERYLTKENIIYSFVIYMQIFWWCYCICVCWMPLWRWPKKVETCSRLTTCLYITVSNYNCRHVRGDLSYWTEPRIILKWNVSKKYDRKTWDLYTTWDTKQAGRLLWARWWTFELHKIWGLADRLLASGLIWLQPLKGLLHVPPV